MGASRDQTIGEGLYGDMRFNIYKPTGGVHVYDKVQFTQTNVEKLQGEEVLQLTTEDTSGSLHGGAIAGIVIVCLAPFLVAGIGFLAYGATRRAQVLKAANAAMGRPAWVIFFTVLVVLCSLAGAGNILTCSGVIC